MNGYRIQLANATAFVVATGMLFCCSTKQACAASAEPGLKELMSWRESIARTPQPSKGCFAAEYPKVEWHEVPCVKAPVRPYLPSRGGRSFAVVGNGNDVAAEVSGTPISQAVGSFDSVSGVVNEYGIDPSTSSLTANIFSLQLNSNVFSGTPACHGVSGCEGWAQFVYSNSAGQAFMQYWLINYGPSCPASGGPASGWISYSNDCYGNSNAVVVTGSPPLNISGLGNMAVTGQAASGGNDTMIMHVNGTAYSVNSSDSVVNLATYWQTAEFNIFGDGNGSSANFNNGSSTTANLKVRTTVNNGGGSAPSCLAAGYTAETNNLYFGTYSIAPNAVVFWESSTDDGYSPCQHAASTGDTHLTTFAGLQYDFQSTGDFLLTEVGSDFVVQTRQASPVIDPRWKDTSINKAVAVKIGETLVALYVGPTRLTVDGKAYDLKDGDNPLRVREVQIARKGDEYLIMSPKGDHVRATLFDNAMNKWMNVTVNLSGTHRQARGLLGGLTGKTQELMTSDGAVLNWPVSFHDLYHLYGESWRVKPADMLLEPDPGLKPGIPEKPVYATDLMPFEAKSAMSVCKAAGVTKPALLEACALDTIVLGDNSTAVKAYLRAVPPREVMPRPIVESPLK